MIFTLSSYILQHPNEMTYFHELSLSEGSLPLKDCNCLPQEIPDPPTSVSAMQHNEMIKKVTFAFI